MSKIKNIKAEEIKDSRGNPALRVTVFTENNEGFFDVPSGASTGKHEAYELRDADGIGVQDAINIVEKEIAPALGGIDSTYQKEIDETLVSLDGTPNKSRLGGNSMIGVSVASARVGALSSGIPLYSYLRTLASIKPSQKTPMLFINLINGGKHASGGSPFQEHHVIPETDDVSNALEMGKKIQSTLHKILTESGRESEIGDEGGFVFPVGSVEEPFKLLLEAVDVAGLGDRVSIGADIAASSFFHNEKYHVFGDELTAYDLADVLTNIHKKYNLNFIEDPFEEEDFLNFAKLKKSLRRTTVIGDDLTVTNKDRIEKADNAKSVGAVIIKPNQIGTLTETLQAMRLAREHGMDCIVSHRSGETMDSFIADLTYAFGCLGIKTGAPGRPERDIKYKRIIKISNE